MTTKSKSGVLWEIIAVGILAFAGVLTKTAANVAFPAMMAAFHIELTTVQWVTSAYMLTATVVIPLSAYLQRNFANRRLFLAANVLFTIGTGVIAWSPYFSLVIVGRVIQGIGNGIAIPLMFNIILEEVAKSRRGMMMGVGTLITATAGAIGPTYGGILVAHWGWRAIFAALLPLLICSLFIGLLTIQGRQKRVGEHFDSWGACLLTLGLLLVLLAQSGLGQRLLWVSLIEYGSGIICLVAFTWWSTHISKPLLDLRVFKRRLFVWLSLSYFATFMIFLSMSFVIPNYVQLVLRQGSLPAGLAVLPGATLAAVLSPVSGHLLDRTGARHPILGGVSLMLVGMICFSVMGLRLRLWQLICIYLVMMAGMGLCASNIMTTALNTLPKKEQPVGNAVLNTLQQFAGAFGTSLSALIIGFTQRRTAFSINWATAYGMQRIFLMFSVIIVIELIILVVALPKRQPPSNGSDFL